MPFLRTPKGTVARYGIDRLYTKELDDIYRDSVGLEPLSSLPVASLQIEGSSEGTVRAGIREAIQIVSPGLELEQVEDDDNLLAVSQTISKHLPSFVLSREPKEYVILTGTTGAIGLYLLDALCKNNRVAKVWCLNRSSMEDAACRQAEIFKSKGLSSNRKNNVRFVQMDLASEALGLSQADLREIRDQATTIIHASINGYGASKLVAEHLLNALAYLGKLPVNLGGATALDWISIDLLAEVMGQLIDSDAKATGSGTQEVETYYNIVNP
ncbi:uncharacterized protein TrAFT101_000017 [Trichoderma asperellum]|uniref:uncharacterized protein n=1 Tax=Trichoderma asperellum TaxID=101201 RepID=UPI0033175323|nr:hypothetical protein TrAFT101_000017 [Trichoderma asperellum]